MLRVIELGRLEVGVVTALAEQSAGVETPGELGSAELMALAARGFGVGDAFRALSLGEVQLLLLGLWVIGEENRVDPRLEAEYGWMLNALAALAQGTAGHVLESTPPVAGVATQAQLDREARLGQEG